MMMDKGQFVKMPIEIHPAANGGYMVRRQADPHMYSPISDALAFSNYTDLLNWMVGEFPAAHQAPSSSTQEG